MARLSLRAEARRFYFGYLWWVLEPLLYVAVFFVVFEMFLGSRTPNFLMFLAVGKLFFIWFSKTVNFSSNSILAHAGLLGGMHIPKVVFPLATVLECTYKQSAVIFLLLLVLLVGGVPVTTKWFWVVPIAIVQLLLIVAVGMTTALLACIKKDFIPLVSLGIVFLLFVSGVFWDINDMQNAEALRWLKILNPLAFLLDAYRQIFLWQQSPNIHHLVGLAVVLIAILAGLTKLYFRFDQQLARRVIAA